ncbi:MAG: SGNH/GDSL hydrolase family protein [Armatimonadetes bacterium]|nr:SGNH/GDSL hydrolase family protein [Armatimonadota bacterium]
MIKRIPLTYFYMALLAVLLASQSAGGESLPRLKTGDRVVFLGDSITEQRMYTRYVMDYFTLRHPGVRITFRNAGWGGDTSQGGATRLQRDVLSLKPRVVSICYGMNDGRYAAFNQENYDAFMSGMEKLLHELKAAGVSVVLLTPGCVDEDKQPGFKGYNKTLAAFAKGVLSLASREGCPVFDLHSLMLDALQHVKADGGKIDLIGDGVHPGPAGHAIMAYALLSALGCGNPASAIDIDVASKKVTPDRCKVSDLAVADGLISFKRVDEALPFFTPDVVPVLTYAPSLVKMNEYRFKVTGLKSGTWRLGVEGEEVGLFSAKDLASGIDLSTRPGPWRGLLQDADRISSEQESLYFLRWRQVALLQVPKEAEQEKAALLNRLDRCLAELEARRIGRAARGRPWEWRLTFVP